LYLYLNTTGLSLGIAGALGLALLPKNFIKILDDGSEFWGPPEGKTQEQWQKDNLRLLKLQKFGLPLSYLALGLGFAVQIVALWLPQ